MTLGNKTNIDENSDEKHLVCNDSASDSRCSDILNSSRTTAVSEHHVGQYTIIRSLEDRKKSLCFSDLVIQNDNCHLESHGELFNDLECDEEDVHRKTSKIAKLGVALVILMLTMMIVIVIYCVQSSPRDLARSADTIFKDKTGSNHTSST